MVWHNCTENVMMPDHNNVALSSWQASEVKENYGIDCIPLGMGLNELEYKPVKDISDRFLFVARIDPRKGLHYAAKVCAELGVELDIIGGMPADDHPIFQHYLNDTLSFIKEHSNLHYLGEVSQEEKIKRMQEAKATILPYMPDAHSLVLIESMLCGTPVIALNEGAFVELNIHGITGFNMNRPEQMRNAIKAIGMIDRTTVRNYAMDKYSYKTIIPRYEKICQMISGGFRW
ncbi:MAG: glycosyltransferase [Dehalococcoidales bacterium]|nr:glycosyltransferase [Dehalococcoidales bacterium]